MNQYLKIKPLVISTISFCITILIGLSFINLIEQKQIFEKKVIAQNLLSSEALTIKNQLDRTLASTLGIGVIIKENNGKITNFKDLAKAMTEIYNAIDSLNIAPDYIVKEIYPVINKEQLFGVNLLSIEERKDDIIKAVNSKKLTLGGPYSLMEGGLGLMGRYPVYLNNNKFWGMVNVTIRFDDFIKTIGFDNLEKQGYSFELFRYGFKSEKITILENGSNFLINPITIKINLPNNEWYLSLSPKDGWSSTSILLLIFFVVLVLAFILSIFLYYILIQPDILNDKIKLATLELEEKNVMLQEEMKIRKEKEELLRQSEKMASFGKLTSAIAHEIRQPLNSIKILTDGVLFWNDENQKTDYNELLINMKNISSFVDRIEETIENMRLMINAPDQIEINNININEVIKSVTNLYKQKLFSHGINIKLDFEDNISNVNISDKQFCQILINLLDNSIYSLDITKIKKKEITIKTAEENNYIHIYIQDNGIGIPSDLSKKIFEPFFTTKNDKDNMGMGLYLVSNILKNFSGEISVVDEYKNGAKFLIKLKVIK